jgi:hypothetical protein
MITISGLLLIQSTEVAVIWDIANQGQFDHINRMITLSVFTLNGFHCISLLFLHCFLSQPQICIYIFVSLNLDNFYQLRFYKKNIKS